MRKVFFLIFLMTVFFCCKEKQKEEANVGGDKTVYLKPELNEKSALFLYHFAYDCIDQEYPNKPGQVLGDKSYLKEPSELHPAFYGCFDWHSSVHGHWTLLNIMKELPSFEHNEAILKKLKTTITKENILKEITYFDDEHNKNFERTYGWAWLLKIAETLQDWDNPDAKLMYADLKPLAEVIEKKYMEFLPKLNHPIRVGEHPNTAFGLSLALDYAKKYSPELALMITEKAKTYYIGRAHV